MLLRFNACSTRGALAEVQVAANFVPEARQCAVIRVSVPMFMRGHGLPLLYRDTILYAGKSNLQQSSGFN